MNPVCERGGCGNLADFLVTWADGRQTLDCGWHVQSVKQQSGSFERLPRIDPRSKVDKGAV